jgi:WD40 repeat protein
VRLASGSWDKTVKLWDAKTGAVVQTLTGHTDFVTSVAFSPDGTRLASGSHDNTVKLWDATTGAVIQTLTGHTGEVTSVAFSPDGARLASGSNDKKVKLWDAKTGAVVQALTGHTGGVARVAFSPDGARLASKDQKQRVKVWDVATGKETSDPSVAKWFDDTNAQSRSPDGKWFGIPHDDGTILLIKPLAPDDFELGYRAWFARPDPDWHSQQAQKFDKEQSWFAAAFHCEQVLKSRPDDAEAKTLLEKAREQLEKP